MELLLKRRPFWVDLILMITGTGLMAVAIQCIFDPIGLVTGGFTGIAIITKSLTHGKVPLWLANLILNIPLFFVATHIKGKRFVARTVIATILLSLWLYILPVLT